MVKIMNFNSYLRESNSLDSDLKNLLYKSSVSDFGSNQQGTFFYFCMFEPYKDFTPIEKTKVKGIESFEGFDLQNMDSFVYTNTAFGDDTQLPLSSLKGLPKKVNLLEIGQSKIKNLIGAPEVIGGNLLLVENSNLESLVGSPESIGGNLVLQYNPMLKTLDGGPKEINGRRIEISYCGISSLKGCPDIINTTRNEPNFLELRFNKNNLTSLLHFPTIKSTSKTLSFSCQGNKLISLFGLEKPILRDGIEIGDSTFTDFENNLLSNEILLDHLDIAIRENSWTKPHRLILKDYPEEIANWMNLATDEEVEKFLDSLKLQELIEKNPGKLIMTIKPISNNPRVKRFFVEKIKLSPLDLKNFGLISGLSDFGF